MIHLWNILEFGFKMFLWQHTFTPCPNNVRETIIYKLQLRADPPNILSHPNDMFYVEITQD